MKKFVMMSASLSMIAISGLAHAADTTVLTTTTTSSATSSSVTKKPGLLNGGARLVPDTTPAPAPATGTIKKSDQGYSKISTYNVVNDQNKPITNDWSRPQNWRIGYKNKNRTPINE